MNWNIALTSAVIAAFVAAAANITAVIINIHQSRSVEFNKHKQAILEYRCEKLFSLLNDVFSLGTVDEGLEINLNLGVAKQVMPEPSETGKRYSEIRRIWNLARPMMAENKRKPVDKHFLSTNASLKTFYLVRNAEEAVVKAIQAQLEALLTEQNKA